MSNSLHHSVTTNELYSAGISEGAKLKDPTYTQAKQSAINQQTQLEEAYVLDYQMCPANVKPTDVTERLVGLKPAKLKEDAVNNFYNFDTMLAVGCIASSLYAYKGEGALSGNDRLRAYVTDIRRIGAESASGFAMRASLGDKAVVSEGKELFILKAPRDPKDSGEIIHECMVAFYGTNQLRKSDPVMGYPAVPFYAWVYGMFKCTQPFINESDKKVLTWCNSTQNSPVAYAIYENIIGDTFGDHVLKSSPQEALRSYIATMFGVKGGNDRVRATQFDLHHQNVLMRKVKSGSFYVPVVTRKGIEYLHLIDTLPTIIDFGRMHIELNGSDGRVHHFGHPSLVPGSSMGIYRDRAYPLHDAYKLLNWMLFTLKGNRQKSNLKAYQELKGLLSFFNQAESPDTIIEKQLGLYYSLPLTDATSKLSIDEFIEFCRKYSVDHGWGDPVVSSVNQEADILECAGDCLTFNQELERVGIELDASPAVPTTFLQFYDTAAGTYDLKSLMKRFKREGYQKAYNHELERFKKLNADLQEFMIYRLPRNYLQLIYPHVLKQQQEYAAKVAKFIDAFNRMNLSQQVLQNIGDLYQVQPDSQLRKLEASYGDALDKITPFAQQLLDSLDVDNQILDPVTGSALTGFSQQQIQNFLQDIKTNPKLEQYNWYWNTYPLLLKAFTSDS